MYCGAVGMQCVCVCAHVGVDQIRSAYITNGLDKSRVRLLSVFSYSDNGPVQFFSFFPLFRVWTFWGGGFFFAGPI